MRDPGTEPLPMISGDVVELTKMIYAEREAHAAEVAGLQDRVAAWVRSRIGDEHMQPKERAMRLLEEACELAQAHGIPHESAIKQVEHVFSRPAGEPSQEAAGVAVCLLGWCAATENNVLDLAVREIERIEAKPISQIRGSVARKADADLVTCVDSALAAPPTAAAQAVRKLVGAVTELRKFEQSPVDPLQGRDDHQWNNLRFRVDCALAAWKEATRG